MSCACEAARCLRSVVVGYLRVILFCGACVILFLAFVNIVALNSLISNENRELNRTLFRLQMLKLVTVLTAFLGIHGAFFGNRWSLKMFSALAGIKAIIIFVFIIWANSSGSFEKNAHEVSDHLIGQMDSYNWDIAAPYEDPSQNPVQIATWDNVQHNGTCCGIFGPHDWDNYRPLLVPETVFPKSCCKQYTPEWQPCVEGPDMATLGCEKVFIDSEKKFAYYQVTYASYMLFLASIACCIGALACVRCEHFVTHVTVFQGDQKPQPPPLYPNPHIYGTLQ